MLIGPLSDPWIQAEVDKALAPYAGRLPASELAWMRERLLDSLSLEDKGVDLVRRARPRYVEESGEVGADGRLNTASNPRAKNAGRRSG